MARMIVIGLTAQGLSMLRMLARAGYEVIAFTNTDQVVGYQSRYGVKIIFSSMADLKAKIHSIVADYDRKVKCIITSGDLLTLIVHEFPDLYDICDVESGPLYLVKELSHKDKMYKFAAARGLMFSKWRQLEDYEHGDLEFPVIMKKNVETPLFFKVKIFHSPKQFDSFAQMIAMQDRKHILVQEYLSLGQKIDISYQAYLKDGKPRAELVAKQVRKLETGITSCLEEVVDQHLVSLVKNVSRNLFANTRYVGFVEVEYIFDLATGFLHFIETNTRPCGTHSALRLKYSGLAKVYEETSLDGPEALQPQASQIRWLNIARDLRVRYHQNDWGRLGDFFGCQHDVWDWRDLKPFFMEFINKCSAPRRSGLGA